MPELVKRNIHMNRWKNQVSTQVTLDDDFIVPDTMSDIGEVILDAGEISLEPVKTQAEKVVVRGKLDFHVLYRKEEGGLQTLGGLTPFEETINVPGLDERDYVSVSWKLEDLEAEMINSRKLGIKAIITLEVKVETLFDTEAAVQLADTGEELQIEEKKENLEVAAIALRRKDTYRLKEELTLPGTRPAIDRILWTQMRLAGVTERPLDGRLHLEGELLVFLIYEGDGDSSQIQWMEESLPFSGELDMPGATETMIPAIQVRLIHKEIEEKPDYDGEMRELDIDAVMELDIRLYEEQELELLTDLYATQCEVLLETEEACFDQILTHNTGKCKLAEKAELGAGQRVLQICHSSGTVKLDEVEVRDGVLSMDGVLEVKILFLNDEDSRPVQADTVLLPFHYEAEVPGITADSVWYLDSGVDQLTVLTTGGNGVEIKAALTLEVLVLQPVCRQVIGRADTAPVDGEKIRQMPGIVGYFVQEGDTLWDIAKRFHTTREHVMMTNHLTSEQVQTGDCLILIKEIG